MRIIFMGTPMFALPSLEKIYKEHEVIAVFTKAHKVFSNKRICFG